MAGEGLASVIENRTRGRAVPCSREPGMADTVAPLFPSGALERALREAASLSIVPVDHRAAPLGAIEGGGDGQLVRVERNEAVVCRFHKTPSDWDYEPLSVTETRAFIEMLRAERLAKVSPCEPCELRYAGRRPGGLTFAEVLPTA